MFTIPLSAFIAPSAETNAVKREFKHIEVKPYASALGAEIYGVDLANMSDEQAAEVKLALADHEAVFFRDQNVTMDDQEKFSQQLGNFGVDPFVDGVEGHPNVLRLIKEANEQSGAVFGGTWHSDWSFQEEPPAYTILVGNDIPPYGGDTLFASLSNAYRSLSPAMQKICESLNVVHTAARGYGGQMKDIFENVLENMDVKTGIEESTVMRMHPMVRVHPDNGKKSLFVTGVYSVAVEGMWEQEGQLLLDYLQEQVIEHPWNLCRFRWEPGSVAMWDNRLTQHYPMGDYKGMRREMFRTIIAGEKPVPVES